MYAGAEGMIITLRFPHFFAALVDFGFISIDAYFIFFSRHAMPIQHFRLNTGARILR